MKHVYLTDWHSNIVPWPLVEGTAGDAVNGKNADMFSTSIRDHNEHLYLIYHEITLESYLNHISNLYSSV